MLTNFFCLFLGAIIIGLQQVDSNWWQGKIGGNVGIFPVTHVLELEIPKLLRHRSKSVHSSEPLFAQALCDSVAQLDEELGFSAGDIITVTEVIDEDWYQGEVHGKSGMFLASCVQLLNETVEENDNSNNNNVKHYDHSFLRKDAKDNKLLQNEFKTEHHDSDRFDTVTGQVSAYTNEVSTNSGEFQRERSISYTSENTKSHNENDAGVTPYARTLYPFEGELADELSFDANDIVFLIQHVDEQWIEGELDGKIGLFPASYVEIVVDCPYAYLVNHSVEQINTSDIQISYDLNKISEDANSNCHLEDLQAESSVLADSKQLVSETVKIPENINDIQEHFALVLYPFDAETSQDLSVREGETVTVIKQIDSNWILVENEQGNRGMCPLSFIEIIGTIPEFTHTAHDKNDNKVKSNVQTAKVQPAVKSSESESKQEESKVGSSISAVKEETVTGKRDINGREFSDQSSAIKTSQSLDSIRKFQTSIVKENTKPPLKPKPQLAPKPALQPKPFLGPKPFGLNMKKSEEGNSALPKSESTSSLNEQNISWSTESGNLIKASSMFEINKSEAESNMHTDQLANNGVHSGSSSSVSGSDTDSKKRQPSEAKKAFENWDMSQPIESFIQKEFLKAAESRSRSGSSRSNSSADSMQRSGSFGTPSKSDKSKTRPVSWAVGSPSVNITPPKQKTSANYCRTNFYGETDLSVGNSTFFVTDTQVTNLRQPPAPPSDKENEFGRKPSLRKPAPPRPKGPRIAPAPSRTPLTPLKAETKLVPARTAPPQPQQTPSRPAGRPRKHVRPAPPRPQPGKSRPIKKPTETSKQSPDNLMSFSPTNTSLGKLL